MKCEKEIERRAARKMEGKLLLTTGRWEGKDGWIISFTSLCVCVFLKVGEVSAGVFVSEKFSQTAATKRERHPSRFSDCQSSNRDKVGRFSFSQKVSFKKETCQRKLVKSKTNLWSLYCVFTSISFWSVFFLLSSMNPLFLRLSSPLFISSSPFYPKRRAFC